MCMFILIQSMDAFTDILTKVYINPNLLGCVQNRIKIGGFGAVSNVKKKN